jgi:hypothetical protein
MTTETYGMLQQAFRETALSRSNTLERYCCFKMAELPVKNQTMLITFFDMEALVHQEFLPQDDIMDHTAYRTVLQLLPRCRSPETASQMVFGTWLLHLDVRHVQRP